MKKLTKLVGFTLVALGLAYCGSFALTAYRTENTQRNIDFSDTQIRRGEYVARLADCYACHTAPNGQPFAGGLAMQTPIGAIYSTNITPDLETGIGSYRYADFKAAVQHGIAPNGKLLYPAMPYTSYVVMSDEDIQAMYAYFMKGVAPVKQSNAKGMILPVLNWRWPLSYWQVLFAPKREFVSLTESNVRVNRGKYLVEGAGHCGACHTPRGVAYQEKALSEDGMHFLSGAVIDGWWAKSLRGDAYGLASWSKEELAEFFKTGRTNRSAAFGAMAEVIEHSTQYWNDEDIESIAEYLKTLPAAPNQETELADKPDTTTNMLLSGQYDNRGALLYAEHCIACHRTDGNGVAGVFPALNRNSAVYSPQAQSVIQVTLEGGRAPHTQHDAIAFSMPAFKHLSDDDVADLVNFVRNGWHNQAPEISRKEVAEIRQLVNSKAPNIVPANSYQQGAHHE